MLYLTAIFIVLLLFVIDICELFTILFAAMDEEWPHCQKFAERVWL